MNRVGVRLARGIVVAAVFWEILQVVGGIYIGHVLRNANSHYGIFATVIALLVFLHLGAQLTVYAAEINVVMARKLWPRSLFGPPAAPADERTLTALAKVEERHDTEQIDVHFDRGGNGAADDRAGDDGAREAPQQKHEHSI